MIIKLRGTISRGKTEIKELQYNHNPTREPIRRAIPRPMSDAGTICLTVSLKEV
jgi:hypothetical protein